MRVKQVKRPSVSMYKNTSDTVSPDGVTSCHQILTPWMRKNFAKLYSRTPLSVSMDHDLSRTDVAVYGALAFWVMQGDICCKSNTVLALTAKTSRRQVIRSLQALIIGGHISAAPSNKRKSICAYQLNSPVFGQKQRDGVQEIVSAPSGGKRLATVRTA